MKYLYIKNWDKWQSYRKDRGTPPWIKIHRNLMTNPEWMMLSDSEKGQLISLWVIAADKSGKIIADAKLLRKMCCLDNEPNLKKFIELQFITDDDATMTSQCQPDDAPETETETETEQYTPDFELFWKEYPRKIDKRGAYKVFKTALKQTTIENLIEKAKAYRIHCERENTEPRFIKHPKTWLNNASWDNEYKSGNKQKVVVPFI